VLSAGATSALLVVLEDQHLHLGAGRFGALIGTIGVGAGLGPLVGHDPADIAVLVRAGVLPGPGGATQTRRQEGTQGYFDQSDLERLRRALRELAPAVATGLLRTNNSAPRVPPGTGGARHRIRIVSPEEDDQ
jgi:hypothetical protein